MNQRELAAISGASARDIDNWVSRFPFAEFRPSGRGRARTFTRDNAIEMTIVAWLTNFGFRTQFAAEIAAKWRESGSPSDQFIIGEPDCYTVINIRKIIELIDGGINDRATAREGM